MVGNLQSDVESRVTALQDDVSAKMITLNTDVDDKMNTLKNDRDFMHDDFADIEKASCLATIVDGEEVYSI